MPNVWPCAGRVPVKRNCQPLFPSPFRIPSSRPRSRRRLAGPRADSHARATRWRASDAAPARSLRRAWQRPEPGPPGSWSAKPRRPWRTANGTRIDASFGRCSRPVGKHGRPDPIALVNRLLVDPLVVAHSICDADRCPSAGALVVPRNGPEEATPNACFRWSGWCVPDGPWWEGAAPPLGLRNIGGKRDSSLSLSPRGRSMRAVLEVTHPERHGAS